jgi:dihydrofolate reductase
MRCRTRRVEPELPSGAEVHVDNGADALGGVTIQWWSTLEYDPSSRSGSRSGMTWARQAGHIAMHMNAAIIEIHMLAGMNARENGRPVAEVAPLVRAAGARRDEFRRGRRSVPTSGPVHEESVMTATYTFDVFSSLDGFGSAGGDWTGYWGKQGPELLDHRLALYGEEQRMVFGANTYRLFVQMLAASTEESDVRDAWVTRMRSMPATVVSTTLEGPLDWPEATVVSGDAVDVVARLKEESEVPLRSHGSLSMNRALMAAGLVDRVQVTLFPVITGRTGADRIFEGAADFDLELLERRTLDGDIQELVYHPTLHP